MADLDRLGKRSPAERARLQQRLVSRAAAKLRTAAAKASPDDAASPAPPDRQAGEPIAIVGMACRFAGAPNLEAYWRMIRDGLDGVVEVPPERWPVDDFYDAGGGPGKTVTRRGAFVEGIDQFEPTFFGVTPREAARMDPQQRMLLEVAWETFENAGRPADRMAGTLTGVYVGVGGMDYAKAPAHSPDYYQRIDAHVGVGNALSIASNRVSYALDLRGPSLSVDTACSSSSLAIHLAVEALRRGECSAALAGGVNAILVPDVTIAFSQAHMLSPEGRCRSYDADASGYVRGEGCAFVMLKRLADAQRDGDEVLALLLGTAVNQDGRTPGISAPSVIQQQACLHAAQADAGITAADVDYIEGHGTGTPLGDPIELQALAHVFRRTPDADRPLWLTSVKANIGHTETVSGAAGLIKTVLLLRGGVITPQLHLERLNPHARIEGSRVEPVTSEMPWPRQTGPDARRRIAGVSSFGFGGTNTHLIVAEAPAASIAEVESPSRDRAAHVVKLAAKTPDRIPEQASRLAEHLRGEAGADAALADVAHTANTGRCDFAHRVALVAGDLPKLLEQLDRVAAGESADAALPSRATAPSVAWLFTGQGAQRVGMGRDLYRSEPVFRDVVDRCDAAIGERLPDRLLDVLYDADEDDPRVHQTLYTQPALFAVECGLAALWRSWGVEPDVVLGHSVGEYAAAVTAGVFSLEDGARLVAERARLMDGAPGVGSMTVVMADEAITRELIATWDDRLSIAAANGPRNTVVSGEHAAVEEAEAALADAGVETKRLVVSHGFHSSLMDPVLDEFERLAREVEHNAPLVPIASNVTGGLIFGDETPEDWARYWREHLRGTVRFSDGVAAAASLRATHWIEIGPLPILAGMAARCDAEFAAQPKWIPSLRPAMNDDRALMSALADHWAGGGSVDWRAVDHGKRRRRLSLPNYPLRRERFWYDNLEPRGATAAIATAPAGSSPVLGARLPVATGGEVYETAFGEATPAWVGDHRVQGTVVAPGAMYVEQALAVASLAAEPDAELTLEDVSIGQALMPQGEKPLRLQTVASAESAGRRRVAVSSAATDAADAVWSEHAGAVVVSAPGAQPAEKVAELQAPVAGRQDADEFYEIIGARGLQYGPAFRVLDRIERSAYEATAAVEPIDSIAQELEAYRLHPVIGDALMQTVACTLPLEADGSYSPHTYVPVAIESVRWRRSPKAGEALRSYAIRRSPAPEEDVSSPETVEADAYLLDESGEPIVAWRGVRVQRLAAGAAQDQADPTEWLYRTEWREKPFDQEPPPSWPAGPTLLFADARGVADRLADRVERSGGACVLVRAGDTFTTTVEERSDAPARTLVTIPVDDASAYERLVGLLAANPAAKPAVVAHLGSLDLDGPAPTDDAERHGVGSAMLLTQQLARRGITAERGLWFVTRSAQATGIGDEEPVAVAQAALVGFGRVAAMEHPELSVKLLDLGVGVEREADRLFAELSAAGSGDNQIALRGEQRFVARLARDEALADKVRSSRSTGTPTPASSRWRLGLTRAGSFDGLRYEPAETPALEPGQVELEVRATGLNFSDVLKALGLYPGIRDAVVPLGIEASGVVTAVGDGVEHLRVGDEALGVLPYAFGSHAASAAYAVVPKPPGVSHAEAATIPIVFLTAHHALVRLAQLERGERVLIHAAAGGVGLAALQIAQHVGAEVFATAGSDEKRDLLRSLGVRHVMDSRSLDFAKQVREATDGEGVDVVLNSLPGEAIGASLGVLRAYGRFCEIGKIDIYADSKIGLAPFQDNLSYHAIDLDRVLRERSDYVRKLFAEVMQRFAEGVYKPLPFTRFAVDKTADAFRYMSQRKNIGKVVVSMNPSEKEADTAANTPVVRGGGYLVTGGAGALGRRVAHWLSENGAGGVALLSRNPNEAAEAFADELRETGAEAVCLRGDVADRDSLNAALRSLHEGFPTIAGVLHVAGVLDDGLITDLDADRLRRVLRPKAAGAWNLHRATVDSGSPLSGVEQFVLFSSVAATLGSPGQANYAAANATLDALAAHRRALGLPATSLGWGPWAAGDSADDRGVGAGMAAGETADAVRQRGMQLLPPGEALTLMGEAIQAGAAATAVFDARWEAMSRLLAGRSTPLLEDLLVDSEEGAASRGDPALRRRLLEASADDRLAEVVAMVRSELARVTSVAPEDIDVEQPLASLGIDSLMALELKSNLESKLAITLPMGKLLAGPSVTTLGEAAIEQLLGESATAKPHAKWEPLVTLREGDETPLFLMPVLGGDVGSYRQLSDSFSDGSSVVAVRPRGIDTDEPPHDRIDETARDYAAAIRARQPEGPYRLGGWSTGGLTALAVAEWLEDEGHTVESVALFDTPPPSVYDDVDTDDDARFLAAILGFAARFSGAPHDAVSAERLAELPAQDRFGAALADAKRAGVVPDDVDEAYVRRLVEVGEALIVATRGYKPRAVDARVAFFSPDTDGTLGEVATHAGPNVDYWRELLGERLVEFQAPGDHFTMISDGGARAIAGALSETPVR